MGGGKIPLIVVPAKAETHGHRCKRRTGYRPAAWYSKKISGYGSWLKAGTKWIDGPLF
jgi:hypothetical protein